MKDETTIAILTLLSMAFAGCATRVKMVETPPPSRPVQVSGTELDPYNMSKVRAPESVHAYYLGPYIDPHDSGIRHDGHRISRVERSAKWNLSPSAPTAVPLGPVVAVADPAKQTAPLSAELENKIAQANRLVAALIEQNEELQAELDRKDEAIRALTDRVSNLETK